MEEYDILIGPVADDNVYLTVKLFETGVLDKEEALKRLKVEKLAEELNLSDKDAVTELYSSHLYEILEQEETKIWQYSTEKLLELFLEERNSGKISFPQV